MRCEEFVIRGPAPETISLSLSLTHGGSGVLLKGIMIIYCNLQQGLEMFGKYCKCYASFYYITSVTTEREQ